MCLHVVLHRTQDDADGGPVVWPALLLVLEVQIEVHLPQFSRKLREKLGSRVSPEKLPHPPDVGPRETVHVGKLRPKVRGETLDHGITPAEPFLTLHDAAPDVPLKHHQFPVHRPPGLQTCGLDMALHR